MSSEYNLPKELTKGLDEEQTEAIEDGEETYSTRNDDEAQFPDDRAYSIVFDDPFALKWKSNDTSFVSEILKAHNIKWKSIGLIRYGRFVNQSKNPYYILVGAENPPNDPDEIEAEIRDAVFDHLACFFDTPELKASLRVVVTWVEFSR